MLPDPNARQFQRVDYRQPTAMTQMNAFSGMDSPGATNVPAASDDTGGHWSGKLPEGVDASWVRRAVSLLGREKVGSFKDMADPEHRKWLRRKMGKAKAQQPKPEPEVAEGEGEETVPESTPEPTPPESRPVVIPSGRVPKGRVVERPVRGLPGPGGWVPAGEGLWWPPYPTTGGPIARPELDRPAGGGTDQHYTLNAAGQRSALEGGR